MTPIDPLHLLLGIRPGLKVSLVNTPKAFVSALGELPTGVDLVDHSPTGLDLIIYFGQRKHELVERLPHLARSMSLTGAIWIFFPTLTYTSPSSVIELLSEDFIRFAALETGLVDNRKLPLFETWSGLRLVWQRKSPSLKKPSETSCFQA